MNKKTAFIGCGNMGSAMMGAIASCGLVKSEDIIVCDKNESKLALFKEKYKINVTDEAKQAAQFGDIIFLCVEPSVIPTVCAEITKVLNENKTVVSIAAGVSLKALKENLGGFDNIVRSMPNLAVQVGCGMSMLCASEGVKECDLKDITTLFESFGEAVIMKEEMIHAFAALASSSPAFIFMLIEAMADGGVIEGIDRKSAIKIAAQTVMGSAKTVLQMQTHPAELKDKVCTPAGMTVEGVAFLESAGFRSAVSGAVRACAEKSKLMGLKKPE